MVGRGVPLHTRHDGDTDRRGWAGNVYDCAIFNWRGRYHLFRMKLAQLHRRYYGLLPRMTCTKTYLVSKRFEIAIPSGHANLPVLRKPSLDDEFLYRQ